MKFLKEQYHLSFSFFRGPLWIYFKKASIAFAVIYLISILASLFFPSIQESLLAYIQSVIDQAGIVDDNGSISAISIMLNNLNASAMCIIYGIIPFLYLPALPIGLNASIIGAVTSSLISCQISHCCCLHQDWFPMVFLKFLRFWLLLPAAYTSAM